MIYFVPFFNELNSNKHTPFLNQHHFTPCFNGALEFCLEEDGRFVVIRSAANDDAIISPLTQRCIRDRSGASFLSFESSRLTVKSGRFELPAPVTEEEFMEQLVLLSRSDRTIPFNTDLCLETFYTSISGGGLFWKKLWRVYQLIHQTPYMWFMFTTNRHYPSVAGGMIVRIVSKTEWMVSVHEQPCFRVHGTTFSSLCATLDPRFETIPEVSLTFLDCQTNAQYQKWRSLFHKDIPKELVSTHPTEIATEKKGPAVYVSAEVARFLTHILLPNTILAGSGPPTFPDIGKDAMGTVPDGSAAPTPPAEAGGDC